MSSRSLSFVYVSVLISSFYRDNPHIGLGPTQMASFYLSYLFKDPISIYYHILKYERLGFQHMNEGKMKQFILQKKTILPSSPSFR